MRATRSMPRKGITTMGFLPWSCHEFLWKMYVPPNSTNKSRELQMASEIQPERSQGLSVRQDNSDTGLPSWVEQVPRARQGVAAPDDSRNSRLSDDSTAVQFSLQPSPYSGRYAPDADGGYSQIPRFNQDVQRFFNDDAPFFGPGSSPDRLQSIYSDLLQRGKVLEQ